MQQKIRKASPIRYGTGRKKHQKNGTGWIIEKIGMNPPHNGKGQEQYLIRKLKTGWERTIEERMKGEKERRFFS